MAHVLIRDQRDPGLAPGPGRPPGMHSSRPVGPGGIDMEELAEEQGWVARMVHLFKADTLDTQFEVSGLFHSPRCR